MRQGGEQPEANDPSATQVNSIRLVTLASLLNEGEAQVKARASTSPNKDKREGQEWLEAEGSEGSRPKQGYLPMQGIRFLRQDRSRGAA
jgi:hypothetical protein